MKKPELPGRHDIYNAVYKIILRYVVLVVILFSLLVCGGCSGGRIPIGDTGVSITDVVLSDRFPPGCEEGGVMCTFAESGSQYLVLWLDDGGSADPLALLGDNVYVTDSSGKHHQLAGGLFGEYFLGQTVPLSASGFTLYCSGLEPIELGK